tara:strand:+ start:277 stop:669 length:393 start_codon:yes stop_codon:yes gene_type:complete
VYLLIEMWLLLIALCIVFFVLVPPRNKQVSEGNYTTNNFEICPQSRQMFARMQKSQMQSQELKKFLIMEDRFLEYEKISVCQSRDKQLEAGALDQAIREEFPGYDFTYHNQQLKQIAEPMRKVNPCLVCF